MPFACGRCDGEGFRDNRAVPTHPTPLPRERLVVALLFFLNGFGFANWATRIPDVQRRLAIGEAELGLALLAAAAGSIVAMPMVGVAVSRWGAAPVTRALAFAFCITLMFPAAAPGPLALAGLLALFGAGIGGMDVAMNALAADHETRAQRSTMAFFHGMYSLGGLLGAVVGGVVAAQSWSPAIHLAALGIVGLGVVAGSAASLSGGAGPGRREQRLAWPNRELAVVAVVAFCLLLGEGAMADWSALYLAKVLEATPGIAASGFAAYSMFVALGRFTGDRFIQRLGPAAVVRWGGALAAFGMAVVIAAGSAPVAILGFALVGAGYSCIFPCLVSTAARSVTMPSGAAIAAVATFGYGGFLLGPPAIGFVAELGSLRLGLGVVAASAVAVLLLGAIGFRRASSSG